VRLEVEVVHVGVMRMLLMGGCVVHGCGAGRELLQLLLLLLGARMRSGGGRVQA